MRREIPSTNPDKPKSSGSLITIVEAPITRAQLKTFFPQEISPTTPIKEHYNISQVYFEHNAPIAKFDVLNRNIFFTDTNGNFYYLDQDHQLHTLNDNSDSKKSKNPTHTFKIDHQTNEIFSVEGNSVVSRQLDKKRFFSKKILETIIPPEAKLFDWGWGHISDIELTPDRIYYIFSLRQEIFSLDRKSGEKGVTSTNSNLLACDNLTIFPNKKAIIGGVGHRSFIIDIMGREPNVFLEGVSSSRVLRKLSENIIFSGSALGSIHRWSIDAPDKPIFVGRHSGSITGILISPKSETIQERVISTDNNGEILLWQATDAKCDKYQGTLIAKLEDPIRGISIQDNGAIVCTAGNKILLLA